jgi:hypothetical protein
MIEEQKKRAVQDFDRNFNVVTNWAERSGAQRFSDREPIRKMARETIRAAEVYAAIARSL